MSSAPVQDAPACCTRVTCLNSPLGSSIADWFAISTMELTGSHSGSPLIHAMAWAPQLFGESRPSTTCPSFLQSHKRQNASKLNSGYRYDHFIQ